MIDQKPTVGRIVHYVSHGSADGTHKSGHRAAIITDVRPDGSLSMTVFNCTGQFANQGVLYDESGTTPGTWHWPERDE